MKRRDWTRRLDHYLIGREREQFAFGTNDCVLFAFGALQVMCDPVPVLPVQPWANEFEANTRLQSVGGTVYEFMRLLNMNEIPIDEAASGDIAGLSIDGRDSLGVVMNEWILGPGESGISRHARREGVRAWRTA